MDTLNKQMNLRQMLANANDPNFGKAKRNGFGAKTMQHSPNKNLMKSTAKSPEKIKEQVGTTTASQISVPNSASIGSAAQTFRSSSGLRES